MGLFSFLKFRKSNKTPVSALNPSEYIPSFWEDDYCQIEIVPFENKTFIQKQVRQIEDLSAKSSTGYGFKETFVRGPMPIPTISKEIRVDYFEWTLTGLQFQKAKHIRFGEREILDCETGNTKAFGFLNFTIFFDTEGEFLKNIWIHIGLIVSAPQLDLIQTALYILGKECELVLVDWNSLELTDLANKKQIESYLWGYWK
jgi:hypothetical protein